MGFMRDQRSRKIMGTYEPNNNFNDLLEIRNKYIQYNQRLMKKGAINIDKQKKGKGSNKHCQDKKIEGDRRSYSDRKKDK